MTKELPKHKDKLGRDLEIGDCVVYPQDNSLAIGLIKKFNPIMIKVSAIGRRREQNKYPQDLLKVDGPEVSVYLLTKSKNN
jgi:hypothetical protein